MQRALRWSNAFLVLLTLTAYLSPYLDPSYFWPISILGLFYPWLLLFNILFIIGWIAARKPYFLYSLGCLLVGWHFLTNFIGFHSGGGSPKQDGEIQVMSYNCHALSSVKAPKSPWEINDFVALIKKHQPDIIFFQEFPILDRIADPLSAALAQECGLKHVYRESRKSLALFSKYPIGKKNTNYFTNHSNGYQYADLTIGEKKIRVYNIHLQTNALSGLANKVAKEGSLQEKETWLQIKGMIGRYKNSAKTRGQQAEEIAEGIKRSPYPVIVGGDFNDVPFSYTYHQLAQPLQDAFQTSGSGLGITFNGSIPTLRIDYILADHSFDILDHTILKEGKSDHFPIISSVVLP